MGMNRALTFADLKLEIRESGRHTGRYGAFLDKLQLAGIKKPRQDPAWDIWYFSDNTEFCLRSSKQYLTELDNVRDGLARLRAARHHNSEKVDRSNFTSDQFRRTFCNFCLYLYAAVESFLHETNILYELATERRHVSFGEIKRRLSRCSLIDHMNDFSADSDVQRFIDYRNAFVHGYVFPISGTVDGRLLLKTVDPRNGPFSFAEMDVDANKFAAAIFAKVDKFICNGWRCFERDELT